METQNLTDDQINVMVAEAMGWTWSPAYNKRRKFNDLVGPSGLARVWKDGLVGGHGLPSFSTSLDACATFEATITEKVDQSDYAEKVIQYVNDERHGQHRFIGASDFDRITATPRQRCIAFLRMKGVL